MIPQPQVLLRIHSYQIVVADELLARESSSQRSPAHRANTQIGRRPRRIDWGNFAHCASSALNVVIFASNCCTFFSRLFMSARNSSRCCPRGSSRFTSFRTVRIASRVRSDTLRAPVKEQTRMRATYSSSERRTLIVRERGFRTVIVAPPSLISNAERSPSLSSVFSSGEKRNENTPNSFK